jgi:excisionase family DNA binding protein
MLAIVSAKELAVVLGCHYRTIVKKARMGEIPCYRSGKLLRFDVEEVKKKFRGE